MVERSDKPDFTLSDEDGSSIGPETTTLYYGEEKAKIVAGRSACRDHDVMNASELINKLNSLLSDRTAKVSGYRPHDKFVSDMRYIYVRYL